MFSMQYVIEDAMLMVLSVGNAVTLWPRCPRVVGGNGVSFRRCRQKSVRLHDALDTVVLRMLVVIRWRTLPIFLGLGPRGCAEKGAL